MKLPLQGHCLCGQIEYEVAQKPLDAGYCHCRLCTLSSGAPVVAWGTVPIDALEIKKGMPSAYSATPAARRTFCGNCGTTLFFQYVNAPKTIDFTLASLSNPEIVEPEYHIWTESQIAWLKLEDGLPRHSASGPDTWT